ncbi:hypothetical protein [Streptomyces sp. ID05-04B]|uniref:hypothetical protein n=1 Tax=Streptomyces sp. ID05-04B TaxID=3028661 RepID=UPI0029CA2CB9|nr:hypothetical protein [Streptomyces sp. ID05-04B]
MPQPLTPHCNDQDCINPRYSHRHKPPTDTTSEPECSEWCGTVNGRTVHEDDCPYRQYFHQPTSA